MSEAITPITMNTSDLPPLSKKRKSASSSEDSFDPCPICLCPILRESTLNQCSHKFCFDCIVKWAKSVARKRCRKLTSLKCPLCRTKNVSVARALSGDLSLPSSITIRSVAMMKEKDGCYQEFTERELSKIAREVIAVQLKKMQRRWKNLTNLVAKYKDYSKAWYAAFQSLQKKLPEQIAEFEVFINHPIPPVDGEAESSTTLGEVESGEVYRERVKTMEAEFSQRLEIIAAKLTTKILTVHNHMHVQDESVSSASNVRELTAVAAELFEMKKDHKALHSDILEWCGYVKKRNDLVIRSIKEKAPEQIANFPAFPDHIILMLEESEEESEQGTDEEDANEIDE